MVRETLQTRGTASQAAKKMSFVSGHDFTVGPEMTESKSGFRACETSYPNSVPQGRLKIGRDAILDNLHPSLRDSIRSHGVPRTSVRGYVEPSRRA
jgi:hypothetical protein